jgi:hypothetical protein
MERANMHTDPNTGVRWLEIILRNDWLLALIIIVLGAVVGIAMLAMLM